MSDFIHLMGAEDVSRAGSAMRQAAEEMRSTASMIEDSLQRHRIFLDEWLFRFEEAMKEDRNGRDNKNQQRGS